ncbi:MAG: hypothetical protein ACXVRD_02690 [Gaiellaceae bacterium]
MVRSNRDRGRNGRGCRNRDEVRDHHGRVGNPARRPSRQRARMDDAGACRAGRQREPRCLRLLAAHDELWQLHSSQHGRGKGGHHYDD